MLTRGSWVRSPPVPSMKILNQHKDSVPDGAIYVGRPSPWGNPFEISPSVTRDQACDMFHAWAFSPEQVQFRGNVRSSLFGHDLVCWCHPRRCHAETLRAIAISSSDVALLGGGIKTDDF